VPPSRVFLRIEDYSALSDHREFQRMADYLHSRDVPFMVAVIPRIRNPDTGDMEDLNSQPEFVSALHYAQQRGGRLILHGYTHAHADEPGEGHEFWDTERDRPIAEDKPEYTRDRVHRGVRQMLKHGLLPLAWETPHYAASRQAYTEIAKVFSTAVEQVQLSDTTHLDKGVTVALTLDGYGRLIVPENLGYVRLGAVSNSCEAIQNSAQVLAKLRGMVGGCYIHAYQPLQKLMALVGTLEELKIPFLDLADLDHVVALPDSILLVGSAKKVVILRQATVRRKAFNRAGKLLAEEQETSPANGERTFGRTGLGDYELIEFVETTP
jgi:predicted deacetylase